MTTFIPYDLYLDSDQVLCDFSGYVLKHYGRLPDNLQGRDKKYFWQWVKHHDAHVEQFFRSMSPCEDAEQLINFVFVNTQYWNSVSVLTAAGFTPSDGKKQKQEWYEEYFPILKDDVICVDKSPDKARYAHSRAILIDDRMKSIEPWVAAGGIGVLHKNSQDTIQQLCKILEYDIIQFPYLGEY